MSIAIIISAHGAIAEQFLKTTEIIIGKQNNTTWINFPVEENTDNLIKKYIKCLSNLNTTNGVLFLVDMWGGSPFNAASQIVINKKNYEIITGINIPMLIEIFMAREDNYSCTELIDIAIKTGSDSIKTFKNKEHHTKEILSHTSNVINISKYSSSKYSSSNINNNNNNNNRNKNLNMSIVLARIDDRLIHGQIVTRWTKESNIKRIIVVSDEVAKDIVRKTLLTQVAPPGITAHVLDIEKTIRVYNNPKYANDKVMLLFTKPADVLRLVERGIKITSVNIGGMAFKQGKIKINNVVSVDNQDVEAFQKLNNYGIELEIRKVSTDHSVKIIDLINKLNRN